MHLTTLCMDKSSDLHEQRRLGIGTRVKFEHRNHYALSNSARKHKVGRSLWWMASILDGATRVIAILI